ncbi:Hypothetical protein A7982_02204 [Minicystis rosea]|nr:Hypothetical protein A7982_02204 [Minicystis rosea]
MNDTVVFDIHGDAIHVGSGADEVWGDKQAEVALHPGMLRSSPETFTRLGLVSNPNSSFGGRPGDVYWIDDVVLMDGCPAGRPVCVAAKR